MTSTQDVTGSAPLTFTNTLGEQRSVPLSALQFSGSTITIASSWTSQFGGADTAILLALAQARVTTGDLTPPPVLPPVPALSFTAAAAGPAGNNVAVKISSVSTTSVLTAEIVIDAAETDTYAGLASATAAATAIGVDVAPTATTDPPLGTGVVQVKSGSATGTGLPKDGQTLSVKAATITVLIATPVVAGVDVAGTVDVTKGRVVSGIAPVVKVHT